MGAHFCEFPTSHGPAIAAKAMGDHVLMGAPNVVRGGSQAGGISAMSLITQGLCDAIVSDYHYPSLAEAAWVLADIVVVHEDTRCIEATISAGRIAYLSGSLACRLLGAHEAAQLAAE